MRHPYSKTSLERCGKAFTWFPACFTEDIIVLWGPFSKVLQENLHPGCPVTLNGVTTRFSDMEVVRGMWHAVSHLDTQKSARKDSHLEFRKQVQNGEEVQPRSPSSWQWQRTQWWDLVPSPEPLHHTTHHKYQRLEMALKFRTHLKVHSEKQHPNNLSMTAGHLF